MTKSYIGSLLRSVMGAPPAPARGSEEFLRLFKKHKAAIYRNLDLFGMSFAQLSFPLLYARCCAGYYAEERGEFLLVTNGRRHYALPLVSDRRAFVRAVLSLVDEGGRVMEFLEIPSMNNSPNRFPEFICETEALATLAGRRLKSYRRDVKRLEGAGVRVEEGIDEGVDEMLALNSQWYSDFEYRKGFKAERRAESEAIIRLASLHVGDRDLVRLFLATAPQVENGAATSLETRRLCGFLVTCRLSEKYWAGVLSRSLYEYSGLGNYLWQRAAQVYLREGVPLENDGTAGSDPALSAYKQRFASRLINSYRLRGRWLSRYRVFSGPRLRGLKEASQSSVFD